MVYRWGNFSLDPEAMRMTCAGRDLDLSRKQLSCLTCLLAHRERVVGFDELITAIWDHADASNQQLAQVVLATRRVIGDNGHSQHSIRTVPGIGYRWIAPLLDEAGPGETAREETVPSRSGETAGPAHAVEPPTHLAPETIPHQSDRSPTQRTFEHRVAAAFLPKIGVRHGLRIAAIIMLCFVVLGLGPRHLDGFTSAGAGALGGTALSTTAQDPIRALRQALFLGRYEAVREGLATLPRDIAEGAEAGLIDIELDIRRGRFARAAEKIAQQHVQAQSAGDTIRQARLLLLQSELNNRMQLPGEEILAPAQTAIELLEATTEPPPDVFAVALWRRSNGFVQMDRFDEAQRDLVRASDLYQRLGDEHRRADVRASLARVWMRTGRLPEALEELRTVADAFNRFDDRIREIFARNSMTKIQIELLRWEDALASNDRSMDLLREVPDSERRYPTLQLRALALSGLGRLREATLMLDEADGLRSERRDDIIPAIHALESGRPKEALEAATREFDGTRIDNRSNLLLENKDGALLVWAAAARQWSSAGHPLPTPSAEQRERLRAPTSATARIAKGHWLIAQGDNAAATIELRTAFDETRRANQPYRMRWAAEPLIELLLRDNDAASARNILIELRSRDPVRTEGDYRVNLLRLRVALHEQDRDAFEAAYRGTVLTAGERTLPEDLAADYLEQRRSSSLAAR